MGIFTSVVPTFPSISCHTVAPFTFLKLLLHPDHSRTQIICMRQSALHPGGSVLSKALNDRFPDAYSTGGVIILDTSGLF